MCEPQGCGPFATCSSVGECICDPGWTNQANQPRNEPILCLMHKPTLRTLWIFNLIISTLPLILVLQTYLEWLRSSRSSGKRPGWKMVKWLFRNTVLELLSLAMSVRGLSGEYYIGKDLVQTTLSMYFFAFTAYGFLAGMNAYHKYLDLKRRNLQTTVKKLRNFESVPARLADLFMSRLWTRIQVRTVPTFELFGPVLFLLGGGDIAVQAAAGLWTAYIPIMGFTLLVVTAGILRDYDEMLKLSLGSATQADNNAFLSRVRCARSQLIRYRIFASTTLFVCWLQNAALAFFPIVRRAPDIFLVAFLHPAIFVSRRYAFRLAKKRWRRKAHRVYGAGAGKSSSTKSSSY